MQFTTQKKKMTNTLLKIMLTDYLQMVYRQGTRVGYTQDQIKALEDYLETLNPQSPFQGLRLATPLKGKLSLRIPLLFFLISLIPLGIFLASGGIYYLVHFLIANLLTLAATLYIVSKKKG